MKIGWIGVHSEGVAALQAVCEADYDVVGLMTLPAPAASKRCGSANYGAICERFQIPQFEVEHVNDPTSIQILQTWNCDLLVVLGWGQILNDAALQTARLGAVGAHASLLPHNRGSAPINWAIIHNESQTGNSLIWLDPEVDTGRLIDQTAFPITRYDTCATLYEEVAASNREMLLKLLRQLELGECPGEPQPHSSQPLLPRRRPQDGVINWNRPGTEIYNLIRALARPYPGARTTLQGQNFSVWQAALLPPFVSRAVPGTILGPVVSPEAQACGVSVATADGALVLLELEDSSGTVFKGRALSDYRWQEVSCKYAA